MKNKIVTKIFRVAISILLLFGMTTSVKAAEVEANVMLQKETNADNKVNVSLETKANQSIASFQLSLKLETNTLEDIKNVTINWNSDILNNAELKELTYHDGAINIYVVSKNELGENNETQKRVDIGTLTIETTEKDNIDVTVKAEKASVKMASLDHKSTTVSNEIDTKVNLKINEKDNGGNNQGDNNNSSDNNNQGADGDLNDDYNQGGDNTQNGGNHQGGTGNGGNDGSDDEYEEEQEEETKTTTVSSLVDDVFKGKLPQTGTPIIKIIMVVGLILVVALLIAVSRIKTKKKNIY